MKRYERQDLMKIVADNGDGLLLSQAWGNEPRDILAIAALAADAVEALERQRELFIKYPNPNDVPLKEVDSLDKEIETVLATAAALAKPAGQEAVP